MSDTPETDAIVTRHFEEATDWSIACEDLERHAKRLERERDEANRLLAAAKESLNAIHVEVGGWIAAMMKEGK